jgi:hypothetical protein
MLAGGGRDENCTGAISILAARIDGLTLRKNRDKPKRLAPSAVEMVFIAPKRSGRWCVRS